MTVPTFERATLDDAPALVAIEAQIGNIKTYGRPLTLAAAREEIVGAQLYLIRVERAVVGTAACRIRLDNTAYLSCIAVIPAFRGRGIGRAAVGFLLEMCAGTSRVDLVTHPENESALRLYGSFGFKVESEKADYFGDGEPRLVLAR